MGNEIEIKKLSLEKDNFCLSKSAKDDSNPDLEISEKEIDDQIKIWKEWARRQEIFVLNPSDEIVRGLAKGILSNEKNHGLKFCPCRLTTGERNEDIKLICPCNFKRQKISR